MHGNRCVRATVATLATCALLVTPWSAYAADAPAPDIATIAAGLEAPEALTRAQAAEALAARYPEAAVAVPVLLDATRDDDPTVRAAAVRTLRLLGRRGQEDAVTAWTTMPATDLALADGVLRVVAALGRALTPTDGAHLLVETCADKPEAARAVLHTLAMEPVRPRDREFAMRAALRDALDAISVGVPFLASRDAATARAAASVVTVLGRSAVAAPFGAAPEDDTASAPAVLGALTAASPAVRLAAWRLIAYGAPHSATTAAAVLSEAATLTRPPRTPSFSSSRLETPPITVDRGEGEAAARSLGVAAMQFLSEGRAAAGDEEGISVRILIDVGAKDLARGVWRAALGRWIGPRPERRTDATVVFALGEDAELASMAAKSLPRLLDTERSASEASRGLLLPVDPSAPADAVPAETEAESQPNADPNHANPCLSLAWLSHRVPEAEMDKGLRARTAGALRRALVAPNRLADRRVAAAILVDLAKPNLVPPATLLAALEGPATKADGFTETALLAALAVGPLPDAGIALLAPLATTRPPASVVTPEDRTRLAASLPWIEPALAMQAEGARAEIPALRRLAAIDALGAVTGDKARAKAVLAPLTKDPDARVRYRAAKALRRLGG